MTCALITLVLARVTGQYWLHEPFVRQDPSRRRPRRQPHPVRPFELGLRRPRPTRTCSPPRSTALVTRFGLEGERLGEVVAGAVLKHSRDFNLARESVLGSKLSPETPATDIQQACGTGLQAAIQVANKIALGQIEVGIAGGMDTTSDAPLADQRGAPQEAAQGQRRAATPRRGSRRSPRSAPATSAWRSRRTASRAPACRWATTPR